MIQQRGIAAAEAAFQHVVLHQQRPALRNVFQQARLVGAQIGPRVVCPHAGHDGVEPLQIGAA